jgi:hypothetical protein
MDASLLFQVSFSLAFLCEEDRNFVSRVILAAIKAAYNTK